MRNDVIQHLQGGVARRRSVKHILATVARDTQFGQAQKANILIFSFFDTVNNIFLITFPSQWRLINHAR
jgi:hypothetical protein